MSRNSFVKCKYFLLDIQHKPGGHAGLDLAAPDYQRCLQLSDPGRMLQAGSAGLPRPFAPTIMSDHISVQTLCAPHTLPNLPDILQSASTDYTSPDARRDTGRRS